MATPAEPVRSPERWAQFRFSVIGALLAAPLARGQLQAQLQHLAAQKSQYVHGLWPLDFHHGSRRVLRSDGQWAYPLLLGVLDDCCRLCCHAQWYLAEGVAELCHGLSQALQKRALPRALMTDNGSAMLAVEFVQGLARLGILHETTLPYSPYQNGKQESFWNQIEGRLLPMLEGVTDLTLAQLNEATLAWMEMATTGLPPAYLPKEPTANPS